MAGEDPSVHFPAELASVRTARQWAARSVRDHGGSLLAQRLVMLLASELVTNAIKYGPPDATIAIDAHYTDGTARILVTDHSRELPVILDPAAEATGGRGMRLVDKLATAWGVDVSQSGEGKTVWFQIDLDTTWPPSQHGV